MRQPLTRLRAYLRAAAIIVWTVALFVVLCCALPLGLISHKPVSAVRARIQRIWSRGVAWIMGMRVRAIGSPPPRPYYLVSNHLSWVDILVLSTQTPCVFVGMAEIGGWPLIGQVARAAGTIFIDRKRMRDTKRVNEAIGGVLDRGEGVSVFAESTTSFGEGATLPFKPALFEIAVQRRMPVHYACMYYIVPGDDPRAHREVCWVDNEPFFDHAIDLLRLPQYEAVIVFGNGPLTAGDRKELAKCAQDAIVRMLPGNSERASQDGL